MEIRLHYEKGDFTFCENLIQRLQRMIRTNDGALFTNNSNLFILNHLSILLGVKNMKEPKSIALTPFHEEFYQWILKQKA